MAKNAARRRDRTQANALRRSHAGVAEPEEPVRSEAAGPWRRQDLVTGTLLAAATLLAYWPALRGGLLWDDSAHITRPELRSWDGLVRIWSELGATQQYYPLLHSAFWIEHRMWGDAVAGYHLINVVLHVIAAVTVVAIVRRLELRGAWLAGFIFALHPVCVNSVAWISEQKSTLSAVFYFAAAFVYLGFDQSRKRLQYFVALSLFMLALLSKTVTATLPAALLLVLWWRRGSLDWKRDVAPLVPWFAIGAAAGLFTAWVERKFIGAEGTGFALSILDRCLIAGRVVWFYFAKLVWPLNLVFIYPHWNVDASAGWQYVFPLGAIAVAAALAYEARRRRGPLAAFLYFTGTLFPVLGFLNVYPFVYSYVADHFQYLASVGVIVPVSYWLAVARERVPVQARKLFPIVPAILLAVLATLTWRQASIYRDSETVYQDTLRHNPDSWMAHNNLGAELLDVAARRGEAISHLETALQLKPDSAEAHNNLGKAYMQITGRRSEAIANYEAAVRLRPRFPEAQNNLGSALTQAGRGAEAIPHFEEALRVRPNFADAHTNLGVALLTVPGRGADAIEQFEEALRLNPDSAEAHNGLGSALSEQGHSQEAIQEFQAALRIRPDYAEAHSNLGEVLSREPDRLPNAVREYEAALRIRPDYAEAHNGLGVALSKSGKAADAIREFEAALKFEPDYAEAHNNLGTLLAQLPGRESEAIPHFEAAVRGNPISAEAHANLGNALMDVPGRLPDAIQQFETAVRLRPDFVEAHYLLGIALARSPGRSREALEQLEEAQRLRPDPKLQQLIERIRGARR